MKRTNLLGAKIWVEDIGDFSNRYTGEARLVGYRSHRPDCYIVEIPREFGWYKSIETDRFMSGYEEIPKGHSLFYCRIDSIQIIVEEEKTEIKKIGGIGMLKDKDFIVTGINKGDIEKVAEKVTEMGYIMTMHAEPLELDTEALIESIEDCTADLATAILFGGDIKIADYIMGGFNKEDLTDIRDNVVVITAEDFLAL